MSYDLTLIDSNVHIDAGDLGLLEYTLRTTYDLGTKAPLWTADHPGLADVLFDQALECQYDHEQPGGDLCAIWQYDPTYGLQLDTLLLALTPHMRPGSLLAFSGEQGEFRRVRWEAGPRQGSHIMVVDQGSVQWHAPVDPRTQTLEFGYWLKEAVSERMEDGPNACARYLMNIPEVREALAAYIGPEYILDKWREAEADGLDAEYTPYECGHLGHSADSECLAYRWEQAHPQNPYDHDSGPQGCSLDCAACTWAEDQEKARSNANL